MARKKIERIEKHKQSLGEVLEDPESYGVRVGSILSSNLSICFFIMSSTMQTKPRSKKKREEEEEYSEDEGALPPELTGKIMKEAHLQQEELKRESEREKSQVYQDSLAGAIKNLKGTRDDETDEDVWSEPESDYNPEDWEAEIDEEDEAVLAAFMSNNAGNQKQRTLADIIMEKIKEKESGGGDNVRYVWLECVV